MELATALPIGRAELADAVRTIARTGEWRAPGAAYGMRGAAVDYLVGHLAAELRALATLVDRSRSALDVEERALARTVEAIRRQASAADAACSAAAALDAASVSAADHAGALATVYERLPEVIATSIERMREIEELTRALRDDMGFGAGITAKFENDWGQVRIAAEGIAKSGRNSAVLAISAAIEAAYVSESGGFGIVAERVRSLSDATLAASTGVERIVRRAHESALAAHDVIGRVGTAMEEILSQIVPARGDVESATERVGAFGDDVARVAAIADEQSAVVPQIRAAILTVADLSGAIAKRAQTDAHATIAHGLGEAAAVLATHRGLDAIASPAAPMTEGDALADWIVALAGGELPAPPETDGEPLREAIEDLLARVVRDERVVVANLSATAKAVNSATTTWRAIARDVRSFEKELAQLASALAECIRGASTFAEASTAIAGDLSALEALCARALGVFATALDTVEGSHSIGSQAIDAIRAIHTASDETQQLVAQVLDVADDAGLLALNAAVEAARAGERGRGFTVIASEIGHLAAMTQTATDEIVTTTTKLRDRSSRFSDSSVDSMRKLDVIRGIAQVARASVDEAGTTVAASVRSGSGLGQIALDVASTLKGVARQIEEAQAAETLSARDDVEDARLALAMVDNEALHVTAAHRLGLMEEHLRDVAYDLTLEIEAVLQRAADAGEITVDQMLALDYTEMQGALFDRLAPFADVKRFAGDRSGTKRYCTAWDHRVDREIVPLLNAFMEREGMALAYVLDPNCFVAAYPTTKLSRGDDGEIDPARWGAKVFLSERQAVRACRLALSTDADALPPRLTEADLRRYRLDRIEPRPWQSSSCLLFRRVCHGVSHVLYVNDVRVATVTVMEYIAKD
jgi:methyl-accepting chemotaxis protein